MRICVRTFINAIVDKNELVFVERELKGALEMLFKSFNDLLFVRFLFSLPYLDAFLGVAKVREDQKSIL